MLVVGVFVACQPSDNGETPSNELKDGVITYDDAVCESIVGKDNSGTVATAVASNGATVSYALDEEAQGKLKNAFDGALTFAADGTIVGKYDKIKKIKVNITTKKNIAFDLGRILVGLDNERCIAAFEKVGLEKIAFYVREHRVEDLFLAAELGNISTAEFCDEVRSICQSDVPDRDIIWAWNELLTGIPDEKKVALLALRKRGHRIYLLSNTNFMHWNKCADDFFGYRDGEGHEYGVDDYFDKVFLSCAMHLAKPDPQIFVEALQQAGIKAEDTLFIDDREANIEAAAALGIHGFLFDHRDPDAACDALRRRLLQSDCI